MKESLDKVDGIFVVSKDMKDYLIKMYNLQSSKITIVPPGGHIKTVNLEKQDCPSVVYSGMLEYRENVELFIRSMTYVLKEIPTVKFYLTKKGSLYSKIKSLIDNNRLSVEFYWYDDEQDFYTFLSSCHVAVLPSSNNIARKLGTPVKMFDYLSYGLPIVTNFSGSWSNILTQNNIGTITPDEPRGFASGIIKYLRDEKLCEEIALKSQHLIKSKYNWEKSAKLIEKKYNMMISEG